MNRIWTTKEGKEIHYKKLTDSHLRNIIEFVKREAKKRDGEVITGGGYSPEDFYYEIGDEQDWLELFDYDGLVQEAQKRKLII